MLSIPHPRKPGLVPFAGHSASPDCPINNKIARLCAQWDRGKGRGVDRYDPNGYYKIPLLSHLFVVLQGTSSNINMI